MENMEKNNTFIPIPERQRPAVSAASAFMLLATAGLWLASLAVELWARAGSGEVSYIGVQAALDAAYYLPFMVLPVALYMRGRDLFDGMRLAPLPFGATLLLIPLAILSVYAADLISVGWEFVLEKLGLVYDVDIPLPKNTRELTLSILVMAAVPAVCEELLLRGFVMSAWEGRGTKLAIIVSAAMFALLHGNIFGLPVYFLLGLMIGWLVAALDSLYAGIVFHTIYNTACLVIPYLLAPLAEEAEAAVETAGTGTMALSMIVDTAIVLGVIALLLRMIRVRSQMAGVQLAPSNPVPLTRGEKVLLVVLAIALIVSNAVATIGLVGGGA